jgi:hypothetical protein
MSQQNNVNIHKIERVDESFYFDTKSIYDLVIHYDAERFQCVSYSAERAKFVLQAEFTVPNELSLRDVLTHTDIIKRDFRNVHYISSSKIQSIIPDAFYDDAIAEQIVGFQNALAAEHLLYKNQLDLLQSQLVFAIDPVEIAAVRSRFPDVKFTHSGAALLNYLSALAFHGKLMMVHYHQSSIELILMQGKSCLLYNQFELASKEDIIPIVTQLLEQFSLDADTLQVLLSGDIELNSAEEKNIKRYFNKVFFAPRDKRFAYTYRIEDDPQAHKFIALYAASLCE